MVDERDLDLDNLDEKKKRQTLSTFYGIKYSTGKESKFDPQNESNQNRNIVITDRTYGTKRAYVKTAASSRSNIAIK